MKTKLTVLIVRIIDIVQKLFDDYISNLETLPDDFVAAYIQDGKLCYFSLVDSKQIIDNLKSELESRRNQLYTLIVKG